jgi:hypothetical protein
MYNIEKLNISPCSQRVPEEFPQRVPKEFPQRVPEEFPQRVPEEFPQRVPKEFPQNSHRVLPCRKKERPQTLYHVHYVCTRVVTTFGRGDSCPNLVYSATFVALLRHLVSSSEFWVGDLFREAKQTSAVCAYEFKQLTSCIAVGFTTWVVNSQ